MIATAQLLRNHVIGRRQLGNKHTQMHAPHAVLRERRDVGERSMCLGILKLMLVILIKGKDGVECNRKSKN